MVLNLLALDQFILLVNLPVITTELELLASGVTSLYFFTSDSYYS